MSSATPNARSSKPTKQSKAVVILRLAPKVLARFPHPTTPGKASTSGSSSKPAATPTIVQPESDAVDKSSDSNGTPLPSATPTVNDDSAPAPPSADGKKKKGSTTKAGTKRTATQAADGDDSKPRPGPKKRPRLADGSIDRVSDGPGKKGLAPPPTAVAGHKLGPKANTGAINAGLRALDRSGKPCRRWARKGFELKSFTGISWAVGSWTAPTRDGSSFSGDVKSDSSSDMKANIESSLVQSEQSNSGDAAPVDGLESSPAPHPAIEA